MPLQTAMFDDKRFTDKDIDTMAYVLLKRVIKLKLLYYVLYINMIENNSLFNSLFHTTLLSKCTELIIELIGMYIFDKLSIDKKYLYNCMIFRLNIDSCYLWCDFYTDKSKTPFECLV